VGLWHTAVSSVNHSPWWRLRRLSADVKRFVEHWRTTFDWRAHEKWMNSFPQFETTVHVDGFGDIDMHFLHQKSNVKDAIPLLFVHGWPGSFLEVTKMLPMLKGGDGKPAFHVVAPSLPNYAFSSGIFKRGFTIAQYAESCHRVMLALGYHQYVTQGGDWGFLITRALAYLYPKHVKAHHVNWAWAAKPEFTQDNPEPEYSEREKRQLKQGERWVSSDCPSSIHHRPEPVLLKFCLFRNVERPA